MSSTADSATRLPRLGALERWRTEIRASARENNGKHFDCLAAAASSELTARELEAEGDVAGAQRFLDKARLRLEDFWGDPDSAAGKATLLRLDARTLFGREVRSVSDWSTVPAAQGWRDE